MHALAGILVCIMPRFKLRRGRCGEITRPCSHASWASNC